MTTCQKCATVIEEGDAFCPGCGRRVAWERMAAPTITADDAKRIAQAHRDTDGLAWLGLFAGAIVGFLCWMGFAFAIHLAGVTVTSGLAVGVTVASIVIGLVVMVKTMTLGDVAS
jgi:RNA polymerase subunit RPABC4/transcription elongation factor Spt4